MSAAISVLGWVFTAIASLGVIYTILAALAVKWFFIRPVSQPTACLPVTILKPLHGDEFGLAVRLEGFCTQDYPAPVQIIFGVRDGSDPAAGIVKQLIGTYPELDIHLVVSNRTFGANRKISNLINMERLVRHPIIVIADSDITVDPDYLRVLVAALAPPDIGFVTCAYVGVPTRSTWSRLSAMAMNYHFLPSVAFGLRIGLAKPCFGPTIALRKTVFDEIGGLARFADHLADDFEIGRAIRDLGYSFAVPPMTVGHACPERNGLHVGSHELRWARTLRLIDPVSYAGSAIMHPLPFALVAIVLLQGSMTSLMVLAVVCGARMFVMERVERFASCSRGIWWLWPARDLLSALIYAWAFLGKTVTWRGRTFRIGREGQLIPHPPGADESTGKESGPVTGLASIPTGRPSEDLAPVVLSAMR
ncbi:bacteriohopanetetrol glucosamine biosynthesis glycosyltransferase HpnI [Caulobacter sp. S45]|uniref:bacteriohopanetetrol glucosamine biosynthesis glycosyltransferase HpnI n=1 Tax=Caulobacter sp. S45 TaxID=1641861 RepID=UPI00157690DA|nr:bacteriohopanetetrol glucosamine biosynthesis glycosyltransferase HpnI [Caulobacter sp. S45]